MPYHVPNHEGRYLYTGDFWGDSYNRYPGMMMFEVDVRGLDYSIIRLVSTKTAPELKRFG